MSLDWAALHEERVLVLASALFAIGAIGALVRRNALVVLMSVELMLNAANLLLLGTARRYHDTAGHVVAFFVMALAAAEAAVGLGVILAAFRSRQSIDVDEFDTLREPL